MNKYVLAVLGFSNLLLSGCSVSPIGSFGSEVGGRNAGYVETSGAATPVPRPGDPRASEGGTLTGGAFPEAPVIVSSPRAINPGLMIGEWDNSKAMRALFGNYNAEAKRATWAPSRTELGKYSYSDAVRTLQSRIIFAKGFVQEGAQRMFVVTRTAPVANECADCPSVLGGAVFTKAKNEWQLDTQTKAITRTGLHGELSAGQLINIGRNEQTAVRYNWTATSLGVTEEGILLLAETKNGVREIFSMISGGNNRVYCQENGLHENDDACWAYNARFTILPSERPYYDLRIDQAGTKVEEDRIMPVRVTRLFRYVDGVYQQVTR